MVLRQKRENTDVLIIDASKGFIKEGKNNKLRQSDIKRITDTYIKREEIPQFSRKVTREEIRSNDYNLNIPRYVDSSEKTEHWDIYASMFGGIPNAELEGMKDYWDAFPNLKSELFKQDGSPYVSISSEDIKDAIKNSKDVVAFEEAYCKAFETFPIYLKNMLIDQMEKIDISKTESLLSDNIFERLSDIPLIDKYEAFQLLDNCWNEVSIDLEIIQTEGFAATKKVDPHLVTRKKGNEEQELQDGWAGHVLPFNLVQETILKQDLNEIRELESRLADIPGEYETLLDEFGEEDKDAYRECFSEEGDTFVTKEILKKLKELKKDTSPEAQNAYRIFSKVCDLTKDEKTLRTDIKNKTNKVGDKDERNHRKSFR